MLKTSFLAIMAASGLPDSYFCFNAKKKSSQNGQKCGPGHPIKEGWGRHTSHGQESPPEAVAPETGPRPPPGPAGQSRASPGPEVAGHQGETHMPVGFMETGPDQVVAACFGTKGLQAPAWPVQAQPLIADQDRHLQRRTRPEPPQAMWHSTQAFPIRPPHNINKLCACRTHTNIHPHVAVLKVQAGSTCKT